MCVAHLKQHAAPKHSLQRDNPKHAGQWNTPCYLAMIAFHKNKLHTYRRVEFRPTHARRNDYSSPSLPSSNVDLSFGPEHVEADQTQQKKTKKSSVVIGTISQPTRPLGWTISHNLPNHEPMYRPTPLDGSGGGPSTAEPAPWISTSCKQATMLK